MNASLRDLNVKASELARRAESGETITITDRGRPIADLGPHRTGFRFARQADVARTFAHLPRIDAERIRRELDDLVDPTYHDPDAR